MEAILQYGLQLTAPNDPLQKITLERIYQGIARPKEQLHNQIRRLRMVRTVDERQYSRLKRELPYFVCGNFHPPVRRRENFASIQYFVVDLDHLQQADKNIRNLTEVLDADSRLVMRFISPGGDGIKLLFRLQEPCYDAGLYALFYKAFIQDLANRYRLEAVIDTTTHDVSRACFFSVDPSAYFNPHAEAVALTSYFDPTDPDAQSQVSREHKAMQTAHPPPAEALKPPLDDEILLTIRQKLNPNFRPRRSKNAFVPKRLEEMLPEIEKRLQIQGITLKEQQPIQFGKKIVVEVEKLWAEINIFFGKKGFSVVKTTKSGSNQELAELAYQVLYDLLIHEQEQQPPWPDPEK